MLLILLCMMVLQVRDEEVPEAREARRALDRANHAMVKIFVCTSAWLRLQDVVDIIEGD